MQNQSNQVVTNGRCNMSYVLSILFHRNDKIYRPMVSFKVFLTKINEWCNNGTFSANEKQVLKNAYDFYKNSEIKPNIYLVYEKTNTDLENNPIIDFAI